VRYSCLLIKKVGNTVFIGILQSNAVINSITVVILAFGKVSVKLVINAISVGITQGESSFLSI
jgi:hypothetical protein